MSSLEGSKNDFSEVEEPTKEEEKWSKGKGLCTFATVGQEYRKKRDTVS